MKTLKSLLMICLILTINGCVNARLIDLPKIEPVKCPETVQPVCPKIEPPARIGVPEPVPTDLILEVKGKKVVRIDAGGELLLRQYIATRKALKAQ